MTCEGKRRDEVRSKFEMVHFQGAVIEKQLKFKYPVIEVMRRDNKDYKFSEADFPNMDLKEIEWLYHKFRDLTRKLDAYQLA